MKTLLLLLTLCLSASAQSSMERRLDALAMVETGCNDHATGRAGEVSRYQITPSVWRQYSRLPLSAATNPFTARQIVVNIMSNRLHGRIVTDEGWYLTYHRPSRWNHPKPAERDRADRFARLCRKTALDNALAK
jgi:hypothetical protein